MEEDIRLIDRGVDGYRINFLLDYQPGSASLSLFIHGPACTRDAFSNIPAKRFFSGSSPLSATVIGYGKSAKPVDFSFSME